MNQRERIMAIAVGVLLFGVLGWMIQGYVSAAYDKREQKVAGLESEIKTHKRRVQLGQKAARTIADFEQRSLPSNPDVARSLYHDWLLAEIGKAGLIDQNVKAGASQVERELYVLQTFTVTGKGTLPQMVDLLHAFYSVDWLHRIRILSIKPIKDTKLLDIHITVEALSLNNAPSAAQLVYRSAQRLKLNDRQAYQALIVGRNLLGPANHPPQLTVSGSKEGNTNRQVELTARATDVDPLDKVQYKLLNSAVREARFDPASGRLSFTPRVPGKYEFSFQAIDDGFPNKTSDPVKIVVNVTDPPPPPPVRPAEPPKLAFDHAKFTVLTAVLDIGGIGEVWLHVRPTGQTLKLHEGDQFAVGSVKGIVGDIGDADFVFESEGKQRKLAKGEILEQAQEDVSTAQTADPNSRDEALGSGD